MKRIATYFAAPLLGALWLASPAQAVTGNTVFDFTLPLSLGSYSSGPSYSFSQNGIDLTVTAGTASGSGVTGGSQVTRAPLGLGAKNWPLDQWTVDGFGAKDVLSFSTNKKVKVNAIWFSREDEHFSGDQFKLYADGGSGLQVAGGKIDIPEAPGLLAISKYVLNAPLMGDLFGVGAADSDDNWRIAKLSLSAVPGPAPVLLLLGAFGALAVSLRGRKAA